MNRVTSRRPPTSALLLTEAMTPPVPVLPLDENGWYVYVQVLDNCVELALDLIHDPENSIFSGQYLVSIDVLRAITHPNDMDCSDRVMIRAWRLRTARWN